MIYLPDVNFWLALTFESHEHHERAKAWFQQLADGECRFCRLTQLGFLRLATNPQAFADEAVSLIDAWRLYDALLADPRIAFADEPPNIPTLWRGFTQTQRFSPKIWNDAYLAAFACAASWDAVTFDRGLLQYPGLSVQVLS